MLPASERWAERYIRIAQQAEHKQAVDRAVADMQVDMKAADTRIVQQVEQQAAYMVLLSEQALRMRQVPVRERELLRVRVLPQVPVQVVEPEMQPWTLLLRNWNRMIVR